MRAKQAVLALLGATVLGFCASEPAIVDGPVEINGTELFVKTLGSGEPIVVVHGGPGWDHSYFLPQMAELAENHRLVFYDQRVSGRSSADLDPAEITLERFVDDIEALREFLGVDRVHLLGHSFGGMLAMQYAVRHPDRLRSLMLVSSTAASSDYAAGVNQALVARLSSEARQQQAELMQSEAFLQGRPEAIERLMKIFVAANFHDPAKVEQLNLTFPDDVRERSERLQALGSDLSAYDIHDRLSGITCPTLIVRGDAEVLPLAASERIRDAIPGSRMQVLADCGHFPFVECNDQLQAVLRGFLENL